MAQNLVTTKRLIVQDYSILNGGVCIKRHGGCGQGLIVDVPSVFNDELKIDSINERTLDAGVMIDGVLIKDGMISVTLPGTALCIQNTAMTTNVCTNNDDSITMMVNNNPSFFMKSGNTNLLIGENALSALTSGVSNTVFGHNAGTALTIGNGNVLIGTNANVDTGARLNSVVIGQGVTAIQDGGFFAKHRTATATVVAGFITGTNELVETTVQVEQFLNQMTIYANAGTGNDTNDGLTALTAVQTIQKAIEKLGMYYGDMGTILLQGSTQFILPAKLDFCQATAKFCKVIVEGEKSNVKLDNVASIANFGPKSSWDQATGLVGGYTVNQYAQHFVHNISQDRYYVVESNTANTINSIIGQNSRYAYVSEGQAPWVVGQQFELYNSNTVLSYSGIAQISVPANKVFLRNIHFQGAVGAVLKLPKELEKLQLQACRINCPTSAVSSFTGSVVLEGVYCIGTTANANFTLGQIGQSMKIESMWIEAASLYFNDVSAILYVKSTNSPGTAIVVENGDFLGHGIEVTEPLQGCVLFFTAQFYLSSAVLTNTTHPFSWVTAADIESDGTYSTCDFIGGPGGATVGYNGQEGCNVRFTGGTTITAPLGLNLSPRTSLDIFSTVTINSTTNCIVMGFGSKLTALGPTLIATAGLGFSVILCQHGSEIILIGSSANYILATNDTQPIITLRYQSRCISSIPFPYLDNVGTGSNIIKVGANAAGAWTTQNDFAAGSPEYCLFTRGF